MITLQTYGKNCNVNCPTLCGLSSDAKPIDYIENISIINGSIFIEIDTGKIYSFNDKSKIWKIKKGDEIIDYIK